MRIPIIYIPYTKLKKYLHIEKRHKCNKDIVPVGCDCHPTYTLQKLELRRFSLPIDWLNIDPIKGLRFVVQNIDNNFKYFLSNLKRNEQGHIISKKFPYAEFMHEKNLIHSSDDKAKFERRIKVFNEIIKYPIFYLYNIPSHSLNNDIVLNEFYNSIIDFKKIMTDTQKLCIYIRYDESLDENKSMCDELIDQVNSIDQVLITQYIRGTKENGIWGNEKEYLNLYRSLGINVKMYPKLYIE